MEAGAHGPVLLWEKPSQPQPGRRRAGSKAQFYLTAASTDALRTWGHFFLVSEGGMGRCQSCLQVKLWCLAANRQDPGSGLDLQLWLKQSPSSPCKAKEAT